MRISFVPTLSVKSLSFKGKNKDKASSPENVTVPVQSARKRKSAVVPDVNWDFAFSKPSVSVLKSRMYSRFGIERRNAEEPGKFILSKYDNGKKDGSFRKNLNEEFKKNNLNDSTLLSGVEKIEGNADLSATGNVDVSNLKEVGGNLDVSRSRIAVFNVEKVGGNLKISGGTAKRFPNLREIGGKVIASENTLAPEFPVLEKYNGKPVAGYTAKGIPLTAEEKKAYDAKIKADAEARAEKEKAVADKKSAKAAKSNEEHAFYRELRAEKKERLEKAKIEKNGTAIEKAFYAYKTEILNNKEFKKLVDEKFPLAELIKSGLTMYVPAGQPQKIIEFLKNNRKLMESLTKAFVSSYVGIHKDDAKCKEYSTSLDKLAEIVDNADKKTGFSNHLSSQHLKMGIICPQYSFSVLNLDKVLKAYSEAVIFRLDPKKSGNAKVLVTIDGNKRLMSINNGNLLQFVNNHR